MSDQHKHEDSAFLQLWLAMTGASAGDHDTSGPPGFSDQSKKVGHEEDTFRIGGIVAVPIFVTLVLVVTYLIITGMMSFLPGRLTGDAAQPSPVPYNDRLSRINSTTPQSSDGIKQAATYQPRLEYLNRYDDIREGQRDPEFLRSFRRQEAGNAQMLRPESLRPENFYDPTFKERVLSRGSYRKITEKVARIPIDDAMKLLVESGRLPTVKK